MVFALCYRSYIKEANKKMKPSAQSQPQEVMLSAAARALAKRGGLDVNLKASAANGEGLFELRSRRQLSLAVIGTGAHDAAAVRGSVDAWALMQRYHEDSAHLKARPRAQDAAAVFDALEAMRVWLVGTQALDGVRANLMQSLQEHCFAQGYAELSTKEKPPLPELLAVMLAQNVSGAPVPFALQHLMQYWRPQIEALGRAQLKALEAVLDDQQAFAAKANELLKMLSHDLAQASGSNNAAESVASQDQNQTPDGEVEDDGQAEESGGVPSGEEETNAEDGPTTLAQHLLSMGAGDEAEHGGGDEFDDPLPPPAHEVPEVEAVGQVQVLHYKAFTTEFDEVVSAQSLVSAEELARLRAKLDDKLMSVRGTFAKLSARLQRVLLAKQQRRWEFDLEDGVIHSARLARLIASPDQRAIYRLEKDTEFRDTVVTLLLDNSGSMRGRPITIAALSADILARTLERAGIKVEILGFTTAEWKGGRSAKQWIAEGKPPMVGRLNDLRHIIYKAADVPLVRAKRNLGLMLKDGMLKENIDGEALLWAQSRLLARPEARKILMVISDGAPVDDATLSANESNYLDRHLREVIAQIERSDKIELLAIGIGHDVGRYYARSVTLRDVTKLGETMTNELVRLFEK